MCNYGCGSESWVKNNGGLWGDEHLTQAQQEALLAEATPAIELPSHQIIAERSTEHSRVSTTLEEVLEQAA